jgi:membrane protease YdiL (CAAX protease family)
MDQPYLLISRSGNGGYVQELNRKNPRALPAQGSDLTKLVYSFGAFFFAYWLFLRFEDVFLYRYWAQPGGSAVDRYLQLNDIAYPLSALFLLVEMLVVIWLFRPFSILLKGASTPSQTRSLLFDVAVGIGTGVTGFAVTIPFLWGVKATPFISGLVAQDHPNRFKGIEILLFGLFMPIGTELVFRAIAQRKLAAHMSSFATIILSAVLGACLRSIFNFPFSMVLGLLCGTLFWWRGALLPAVVADIVMTVSAGAYVAFRIPS